MSGETADRQPIQKYVMNSGNPSLAILILAPRARFDARVTNLDPTAPKFALSPQGERTVSWCLGLDHKYG